MEKINSIFWFSNPYLDSKDKEQQATVILEVNYKNKNFSIRPYCGTVSKGFMFEESSHKYKMWKAILKGIDQAIDFANIEISGSVTGGC